MLKALTTSSSAHSTTHRAKRHYPPDRDSSVSDVFLVAMSSSESSHFYFFSPPPPMALSDTGRFSPLPTFCRSYPNSQHSSLTHAHTHPRSFGFWVSDLVLHQCYFISLNSVYIFITLAYLAKGNRQWFEQSGVPMLQWDLWEDDFENLSGQSC